MFVCQSIVDKNIFSSLGSFDRNKPFFPRRGVVVMHRQGGWYDHDSIGLQGGLKLALAGRKCRKMTPNEATRTGAFEHPLVAAGREVDAWGKRKDCRRAARGKDDSFLAHIIAQCSHSLT